MAEDLKVFIGYEPRQPLAYNVLQSSIVRHASRPVSITPLILRQLPIKRRGLTEFTFSRFLVPYLCGYKGFGVFMDADMVVTGDIAELFAQADESCDVQVNKQQAKFEWASVMLFNCSRCTVLTPELIDDETVNPIELGWAEKVGEFSPEWNKAVGYTTPGPAKLYHYTQGLPCWPETEDLEAEHWKAEREELTKTCSWTDLMVTSVHAEHVLQRMMGRYKIAFQAKMAK